MNVVLVDDSMAFDGYSPSSQALDGPAKAFASLPTALAMRGHTVTAINRCAFPVTVNGAKWVTWDGERPAEADALIAFRQPRLLGLLARASRRILWMPGQTAMLDAPDAREILSQYRPLVVLSDQAQRTQWTNPLGLETAVIEPGVTASYLEDDAMVPAVPPRAICTAHPQAGLDWLLRQWTERIRPAVSDAELLVFSALLDKGQLGATVPEAVSAVFAQATAARAQGVVIRRPLPDPQMAEEFRTARVHLHPGGGDTAYGFVLADSQATGLPAVLRTPGPVLRARIVDGQTGSCANDDGAFADAAIRLLSDRTEFERMSANARLLRRGRTWAIAAAEWEERLA